MTVTELRPQSISRPPAAAAIYRGTVGHRRFGRFARDFTPKLFLSYLDVDALPGSLDAIPLWSARRVAPVRFRRRDFFDGGTGSLGEAVRDLVEARLGRRPSGTVALLAHLRTFGWVSNPLAVYYCWTADGHGLDALVLEVTNTPWGERTWYVFDALGDRSSARTPKSMHVSPFLPMDVEYRVTWTTPGERLQLRIEVERGEVPIFQAALALERVTLDRRSAIGSLLRSPLMPLRVSVAIYRQALRLFVRRVPIHRHPNRGRSER